MRQDAPYGEDSWVFSFQINPLFCQMMYFAGTEKRRTILTYAQWRTMKGGSVLLFMN